MASTSSPVLNITETTSHLARYSQEDIYLAIQIQLYVSPVLVVIGTLGNLISFVVLVRKNMRSTAMYNILILLAVADTMVLWFSCLKSWIRSLSGFEFLHVSPAACKIILFLFLSSSYLSSWLIALVTIDRLINVWFPMQSHWTLKHARLCALTLVLFSLTSNIHVFWTFGRFPSGKGWVCTHDQSMPFMNYGFEYMKITLYCFGPFLVVLMANLLIIYQLKRHPASGLIGQERDRISIFLLTISFTWLSLMLPYSLLDFLNFLNSTISTRMICFMLMYTNHAINFILYTFTGRKFREELKAMFAYCRKNHKEEDTTRGTDRNDVVTDVVPLKEM